MAFVHERIEPLISLGLAPVVTYPAGFRRGSWVASGKEPFGARWGERRCSAEGCYEDVLHFLRQVSVPGVGIRLGPGNGPGLRWLLDIEGDGEQAEESRLSLFGGELVETRGWTSARGRHELYVVDEQKILAILADGRHNASGVYKSPELPGLEIRLGGWKPDGKRKQLHSCCPPTRGTDGQPRTWVGPEWVAEAPESFYSTLARMVASPKRQTDSPRRLASGRGYAQRALDLEAAAVAGAIEGGRNDQLNRSAFALGTLVGGGELPEVEVVATLELAAEQAGLGTIETRATVRSGLEAGKRQPRNAPSPSGSGRGKPPRLAVVGGDAEEPREPEVNRVEIEVTHEYHNVVEKVVDALANDPELYRRGNFLVRVVQDEGGSPRIVTLTPSVLATRITKYCDLFVWKKDSNGEAVAVSVPPPRWLAPTICDLEFWPSLRPLDGVSGIPVLRPDGSIFETPGYDPITGVLFLPSVEFPRLPERPTQQDAAAAAERLMAPFADFEFASRDDWAVGLSCFLTPCARYAYNEPSPGHVANGNRPGNGKGLYISSIGRLVNGRETAATAYPSDSEEVSKLKVAIALHGSSLVHLDNLAEGSAYGSTGLDSALTSFYVNERVLGFSKLTGEIPLRCAFYISGNNISPGRDADRRWLVMNLLSSFERPEERTGFRIPDLKDYILQHRARLVADALTVLKANVVADFPDGGLPDLGSFEGWSRFVRRAVAYATGLDCCKTRRVAADTSPQKLAQLALLTGWAALPDGGPEGKGVTAAAVCELFAAHPEGYPELSVAFQSLLRDNKPPTARSVGFLLRGMRNRIAGGMRLVEAGISHHAVRWKVDSAYPDPPDSQEETDQSGEYGSMGESFSNPTRTEDNTHNHVLNGIETRIDRVAKRLPHTPILPGDREEYTL